VIAQVDIMILVKLLVKFVHGLVKLVLKPTTVPHVITQLKDLLHLVIVLTVGKTPPMVLPNVKKWITQVD